MRVKIGTQPMIGLAIIFMFLESCSVHAHFPHRTLFRGYQDQKAFVQLTPADPLHLVFGELELIQLSDCVKIYGTLYGLETGNHGFHIHENGDIGQQCNATGLHFNPNKEYHGSSDSPVRHVGDFGNVVAASNGIAFVEILDENLVLNDVVGRTFVVHENQDDLGQGGDEESLKNGNSGKKIACGVITSITKEVN